MSMTAGRRHLAATAGALALVQVLAFGSVARAASTPEQAAPSPAPSATTQSQPAAAAPPPTAPPTATPPTATLPKAVVLSNESTRTTWAHPVLETSIHEHPTPRSHVIARTRVQTEDGFPEVYMLLASLTDAHGREWVRVRIPGRPNGRIGWVARGALGEFHVSRWLIEISLGARRLRAYDNGRLRLSAPVGVGKPSSPTPTGHFWIRELFKVSSRNNPYWPYALGTSAYSTLTDWPGGGVVGIHGDFGKPQLIPGDPSHGCVRMHAADLSRLAPVVPLGTPVHIVR
jgi:hypothetical protein